MRPHRLEELTQSDFAALLAEDPVILLPLGSQEGQGPHCPMGDFRLSAKIADLVAQRTGALAAPVLPFGHADFFRDYPGGLQLRPETFTAVLTDMLNGLVEHGLTRLLILNGHTTNAPLISQVTRQIRRQSGVALASVDLWPSVPAPLMRRLFGEAPVRGHGAEPVTSVMMHLLPGEVRALPDSPRARPGRLLDLPLRGVSGADFEGLRVNLPVTAAEIAPDGRLGGDASRASAGAGAAITADLVARLAALVTHLQSAQTAEAAPTPPEETPR
ncbi:creatininase family protein [Oceanicola sp. S124]|uniref:creatininase family protein n=1 Tax=Oceanicola sp. S124 TaxID=1042378 RepID=UPI0002557A0A|nr:creatininase family protein [Oceanicola sp. S124]